jgi:hypothetical protein
MEYATFSETAPARNPTLLWMMEDNVNAEEINTLDTIME